MNFINALNEQLLEDYNHSVTENGAVGYKTTGKALLDLNFAVSSLRDATEQTIVNKFKSAYSEDKVLALKWLLFARDVRGGLGERRFFRICFEWLVSTDPNVALQLIPHIAEYGRWDDLFAGLGIDSIVNDAIYTIIDNQLTEDWQNMKDKKPISLLAKWMPSLRGKDAKLALVLRKALNLNEKTYRKSLSKLRQYLDIVEKKMSSNHWDKIKYENVPSRANLNYSNAFFLHDGVRRKDYLASLEKGETKINASTLFPHDIVHKYMNVNPFGFYRSLKDVDATIEALWKALPNLVNEDSSTLVVADGSGSMMSSIDRKSDVTALDVANALAIYFAERQSGEFKNKYITFSARPQLVNLGNGSLRDKINIALRHSEVANTNIEATFNLILDTAITNHMTQADLPKNILIISDMEFDYITSNPSAPIFKQIAKRYAAHGYKLPRLVFWNVASRTGTIPVRKNENGVALVSGFSPNVCKMVLSGKLDPYECLLETLNTERYAIVDKFKF